MHYVYLIESVAVPGKRYAGYTENLRQRLLDHNAGKNRSTEPFMPWRLSTYFAFSTKTQALEFERYLKTGSGKAFANKRLWARTAADRESGDGEGERYSSPS